MSEKSFDLKKDIFVWFYEMNGVLNVRFFKSKIIVLGVERFRMCVNLIIDIYYMIRWNEFSCVRRIELDFFCYMWFEGRNL